MKRPTPCRQLGAATLLLVLGLVLLGTLASAWSSRAVLTDLLSTQARSRSLQARGAAQAALAAAQADVLQAFALAPAGDGFTDPAHDAWPCAGGLQPPRWQCLHLPTASVTPLDDWQLEAWAARDLLASPHVWQLHASARPSSGPGQALVRESVFVPTVAPAPANTPAVALLLNGCYSESAGSRWQLCPLSASGQACAGSSRVPVVYSHFVPDSDGNGLLSADERNACLAIPPNSLPGGGTLASTESATGLSPCQHRVLRSVFGDTTPEQLKAWSSAQAGNGLHSLSQPARSIYWVDSPADWTQSLGSPEAPVLLVFSSLSCTQRCPRIASGVQIHGTVFADAGCDAEKLRNWQAGTIDGLLAIEGGLPAVSGNGLVRARAYARNAFDLHWPSGIDARRVQRVAGSHRAGAP